MDLDDTVHRSGSQTVLLAFVAGETETLFLVRPDDENLMSFWTGDVVGFFAHRFLSAFREVIA